MKNLRVLALLCIGLIFAGTIAAGETGPELLTPAERAWLAEHPEIVLGVGEEWAPAVVKDADDRFGGFAFDHLDLLNRKLGTHIRLEAGPWRAMVEKAETGRIAGLNLSAPLEARKAQFLFTQSFHAVQYFIYLRAGEPAPRAGLDGLRGRRVGYLKGILYLRNLLATHPAIQAMPLDGTEALANVLLGGEVDAVVDSYGLEHWRVSHGVLGFAPMRMLPESQTNLVMSIRKDWPELVEILNKGLAAITREEMAELYRRWFGQDYLSRIAPQAALTAEERAWLTEHPVLRVSIDPHRAPVEFVDEAGNPQGISVVYLQRLGKLLGLRIEWVQGLAWAEAKQRIADGGLDVLPTMAVTPDRQRSIHFTEPYLSFPVVIFSAADVAYLGDPRALTGKTVAIVRGEAIQDWLRRDWPQLALLPVANIQEALRKVASGEAFAFVGNLVTTSYYIGQSGLTQIKVAGETSYVYQVGMGVRQDWPLLAGILQKGLDAIPKSERDAIYHDWISIHYQHRVDYGTLWTVVTLAALALFVIVYWNRRLTQEVNQRRQAEAALTQAKDQAEVANRAKSAFLANVSHDLRTPLNAVLGFASLLRGKTLSEKDRGYLEAIHAAGKSLSQLIDDILDLSRIEADKIELQTRPVDPRALLRDLKLMFGQAAKAKGLDLRVVVGEEAPPAFFGDEIRLRQILVNLIGNAIKFTDAGHVEVRATGREEDEKFHLRIAVTDTGPGIPPDQQEEIFHLFTQRRGQNPARYGGAGLGLSICRRLAALMGGEIRLVSAPGQGSTFTLVLPSLTIASRAVVVEESMATVENIAFAPARILVADDNAPNRRLLVEYLSPYGFELIEAEDGAQALAHARQHQPALILMDIAMPLLDGLEATRRLKADPATARIPVIAVTASVTPEQEADVRALCKAYLRKPVSQATLIATLRRFLPHSEATVATRDAGRESTDTSPGGENWRLPAALYQRLQALRPPFTSINELEEFGRALAREGERRENPALRDLGQLLLRQAEAFDVAGLRQRIEALKVAVQPDR
ncbi:MAG: transporter substrate-binding domain-containing protein [Candidatus Contendobacter sp.]|nr:transporter substrate-binding domain-containing protein [Candidatus Contendobacter sp.]